MRPRQLICAVGCVAMLAPACTSLPLSQRADIRKQQYLATHRETPSETATAVDLGYVVPGMDQEQVVVVLGQPSYQRTFASGTVRVWLYSVARFHQDQMHSHGASSFRLTFVTGRLTTIEPV